MELEFNVDNFLLEYSKCLTNNNSNRTTSDTCRERERERDRGREGKREREGEREREREREIERGRVQERRRIYITSALQSSGFRPLCWFKGSLQNTR